MAMRTGDESQSDGDSYLLDQLRHRRHGRGDQRRAARRGLVRVPINLLFAELQFERGLPMTKDGSTATVMVRFSGALLLLACGCRGDRDFAPRYISTAGAAGTNDEYRFLVAGDRLGDGSILGSPIVIWRSENAPSPLSIQLKDGRWGIVWEITGAVEHRDAAVLLYQGPARPLRQLAPKWPTSLLESPEALRVYIECLLAEEDRRREDAS